MDIKELDEAVGTMWENYLKKEGERELENFKPGMDFYEYIKIHEKDFFEEVMAYKRSKTKGEN